MASEKRKRVRKPRTHFSGRWSLEACKLPEGRRVNADVIFATPDELRAHIARLQRALAWMEDEK